MDDLKSTPNRSSQIWSVLSAVVILAILLLLGYLGVIFFNPTSPLNPFPPVPSPTYMDTLPAARPTITATLQEASSPLPSSTPTRGLVPSGTSVAEITIAPSATTAAGSTITPVSSGMQFEVAVDHVSSDYYHPEAGCNWMGVAGQAVDMNNSPVLYLAIHISGVIGGKVLDYISLTGTAPSYGPAGFEFYLGDKTLASSETLWIQLVDQQNLPLTEQVKLTTYNDCSRNLVMIRFKKVQ